MAGRQGEGIVLRASEYGEKDRLLTVFCPVLGKIRSVAKSARRAQSRYASLAQPFAHIRFVLYGKGSLQSFSQAELQNGFMGIRNDLDRMAYGLYLLELVESFLEESQEHDDIFSLLLASLYILESTDQFELLLAFFQVRFLARLGWAVSPAGAQLKPEERQLLQRVWSLDWRRLEDAGPYSEIGRLTAALDRVLCHELGRELKALKFLQGIKSSQR